MPSIIVFNKPFLVLSQFSDRDSSVAEPRETLADYLSAPNFRVAGRLDYDSEGLVILTDDGRLQQRIANPKHKLWKTYWVQVEGDIDDAALAQLREGVTLKDGPTRPARARRIDAPTLWPRNPPVRFRASVPDCWIEIQLQEGRNRQVRRMTAAVGFPTLRLVRVAVGDWRLEGLDPGDYRKMPAPEPVAGREVPKTSPKQGTRLGQKGRTKSRTNPDAEQHSSQHANTKPAVVNESLARRTKSSVKRTNRSTQKPGANKPRRSK